MEVLFWLLPAAVVTTVAMVAVGWWGREGRGEVDRETAARRLGEALGRERGQRPGYAVPARPVDRSSGIAIRPSKARPLVVETSVVPAEDPIDVESVRLVEPSAPEHEETPSEDRRAS